MVFDPTRFRYWNGAESYSNHTVGNANTTNGQPAASAVYDFVDETTGGRPTTQTAYRAAGQYSTHVFTARAVEIIKSAAAAPTHCLKPHSSDWPAAAATADDTAQRWDRAAMAHSWSCFSWAERE